MENRFLKTLHMFRQSKVLFWLFDTLTKRQFSSIFRFDRVKTIVQRTEYDANGREQACAKEGILISSLNFDFLIFWNIAKNKYVAEYDEDYNGEDLEMSGVNIERG